MKRFTGNYTNSPGSLVDESAKGSDFLHQSLDRDEAMDSTLRPPTFDEFTGQRKTCERLKIIVGAAKDRGELTRRPDNAGGVAD